MNSMKLIEINLGKTPLGFGIKDTLLRPVIWLHVIGHLFKGTFQIFCDL